jgi:hypothetical protein
MNLDYEPPDPTPPPTEKELAAHLAEPCTPSSDISTFITPDDHR